MSKNVRISWSILICIASGILSLQVHAQIIDFETLPGGVPTTDQQSISTEYAIYGVTFTLLSRDTGLPIGSPLVAKSGPPLTAFNGCADDDMPAPYLDVGSSFLTDGTAVEVEGDLLIEYSTPVAQASGLIIDIDCRDAGGPPCEQWTITAFDGSGTVLQTVVLDGPPGPIRPECQYPETGPGDSEGFGWVVSVATAQIESIVLRYTGEATGVGLAFDNFSVASVPAPPAVSVTCPADTLCLGDRTVLTPLVSGGLPPFTFQWQRESGSSMWNDIGTDPLLDFQPLSTGNYRVTVTDAALSSATSSPVRIVVVNDGPLCTAGLLVSSYNNDRVLRYSFRSPLPQIFVTAGSGGLNGPSKAICGPDGNLYVSSQDNDRVMRYSGATGGFLDTFVAAGSGGLNIPVGLDFGPDGNLYVASFQTHEVLRFDGSDGSFLGDFVPWGSGLDGPTGLVFGPDDDLYVSSLNGDKVLRFDGATGAPLGDFVAAGSGGLNGARGLTFGPDGDLYVGDQYGDSVRRYDGATGAFIEVFIAAGSGGLDRANDVVFGLDGECYVASYDSGKVLRFDGVNGTFLGELSTEFLNGPNWVTVGCQNNVSGVQDEVASSIGLQVEPCVPNPFNPRVMVAFSLPKAGHTKVVVIDLAGRVVATVLDRELSAGRHTVEWNGRDRVGMTVSSGTYLMLVESGQAQESTKILLLR